MRPIFLLLTILLVAAGFYAADVHTLEAQEPGGVQVQLETVTRVTWERLDDAFRYHFELDGVELGTAVGDWRYFAHEGPLEDLVIRASTFDGNALGETELVSTETDQRLVLRWNEGDFDRPFMGLRYEGGGHLALELTEMPHVIGTDPEAIDILLFGDELERPRRGTYVPFEFDDGEIIEHGPFVELPLPPSQ